MSLEDLRGFNRSEPNTKEQSVIETAMGESELKASTERERDVEIIESLFEADTVFYSESFDTIINLSEKYPNLNLRESLFEH